MDIEPTEDSLIDPKFKEDAENAERVPNRLAPDWSDWLLTQFVPHELFVEKKKAYPKVHGLRRLAQLFVGEIVRSQCICVTPPGIEKGVPTLTCFIYEIEFIKSSGQRVVYSDVADCSVLNTDEKFVVFPSTMAATRAEARALRKALGGNFCSFDELPGKNVAKVEKEVNTDEIEYPNMNAAQKSHIRGACQKLNINPWSLFNSGDKKYKLLNDITYQEAFDFCKITSTWTNDKAKMDKYFKDKNLVPKPFSASWETELV